MSRAAGGAPAGGPAFSVVIPTLDEEPTVAAALHSARRAFGPDAELIVVDGGSRDATRAVAARQARVLHAPRGRGRQMAAGARASSGEVLVFLHADTRVDRGAGAAVRRALADPAVVGGCLRFAVDPPAGPDPRYRALERAVNLRSRLLRTATGDQAIFARRGALLAAGGVPRQPLFEDLELVRRLRRLGRFVVADAVARTSRRRWERRGFWRTVLLHWGLRLGWRAGLPPARLARWYRPAARAAGTARGGPAVRRGAAGGPPGGP